MKRKASYPGQGELFESTDAIQEADAIQELRALLRKPEMGRSASACADGPKLSAMTRAEVFKV